MALPKSLKIGGLTYKVKVGPGCGGDDNFGWTNNDARVIELNSDNCKTEELLWETFRHEAMHAVMHISGLKFILGEKTEEAVVRAMESLLLPALDQVSHYAPD